MAIRNKTVLRVERLEDRDTPAVIGFLGGGNAAVYLETTQQNPVQVVTPALQFSPVDPCQPGLLRAVQGGGFDV